MSKQNILINIFLIITVTILGCATPNLVVGSNCLSEYKYKKKEKIIVTLPKSPNEFEKICVPLLKEVMIQNGFSLADSLKDANRLLVISYFDNVTHTSTSIMGNTNRIQTSVVKTVEDGHGILQLLMYDVTNLRDSDIPLIWQSHLMSPKENITLQPVVALKILIEQYGKNKVYSGKFPKQIK